MPDARECVWPFVEQMRVARDVGLYFAAAIVALTLPDICAALSSDDGRTSGSKYSAWAQRYLAGYQNDDDSAKALYGFRCSLLHQGRAFPHGGWPRIAFAHPDNRGQLHNLSTQVGEDVVGWVSITFFVDDMTEAVDAWLNEYGSTNRVQRNLERFVRLRPEGLPPYSGGPVIA